MFAEDVVSGRVRSAKTRVVILAQLCQLAAQLVDLLVGVLQLARELEEVVPAFDGFDRHDFSLSMFHLGETDPAVL